jgi:glutaconate CoA-transferase subunit B
MTYSASEMMTVAAARLLRNGDVVFVGIGLPNLACNLAHRLYAPEMVMIYEAGVIGAQPARLPLSIGDPCLVSGAAAICSMYEVFAYYLQPGRIDVGFLGGAQIDQYGNVNATVIGPYDNPKVRLPGSGGSAEIAAWAQRTYFITPHQPRRFPARCDFVTGAGFLGGHAQRDAAHLIGGGPAAVVTDLGILTPDAQGELVLTHLHPSATVEQARANTGWPLKVAGEMQYTSPPTIEELRLLREELDPQGIYLKSKGG